MNKITVKTTSSLRRACKATRQSRATRKDSGLLRCARNDKKATESGAVFVYILLAIALLAALTYAVSSSNRGSSSALTDEQARLAAQEIIEYGNSVASAVQKLKLRGVADHEFDFSNNVFKLTNSTPFPLANATCTSDNCKLFNINGGGIEAKYAPNPAKAKTVPGGIGSTAGQGNFRTAVVNGIGSSEPELIFEYTYINQTVCKKINEILGIANPSNSPPLDVYGLANYSDTLVTFPTPGAGGPIGDTVTQLSGKTSYCLTPDGNYYYYHAVIIAR